MYYWLFSSYDSDRDNGLHYLKSGQFRELHASARLSPEVIGKRMRDENEEYEQHKLADRQKEEEWTRAMERNGWQRGKYFNAPLTKPERWIMDPRGWNSNGSVVLTWLPDMTNLLSYFVSIAAILSLSGILMWLAGIRSNGTSSREKIEVNPSSESINRLSQSGTSCSELLLTKKRRPWWRTFLAIVICGLLALGYFVGGTVLFGWKKGGGFFPMLIAGTVILMLWGIIRGDTSEDK